MVLRVAVLILPIACVAFAGNLRSAFWAIVLLLAQSLIARLAWPHLWKEVWKAVGERQVQVAVIASAALVGVLVLSGTTDALAAAREAPENEFGSWGEWFVVVTNLPVLVYQTIIGVRVYRVTRVLSLNTVTTELFDSVLGRLFPEDRLVANPVIADALTSQVSFVLTRSREAIRPDELGQLFVALTKCHALKVLAFTAIPGQFELDQSGRPKGLPFLDPREDHSERAPVALRPIKLHELTHLISGCKVNGMLREVDFSWAPWKQVNFSKADLREANCIGSHFEECSFREADLRGLRVCLSERELAGARYYGLNLEEQAWYTQFVNCDFAKARITPELYSFLESNGSGRTLQTIREAIICLPDGTEVLAKNWRRNTPTT
jgi:hypothetical protein